MYNLFSLYIITDHDTDISYIPQLFSMALSIVHQPPQPHKKICCSNKLKSYVMHI